MEGRLMRGAARIALGLVAALATFSSTAMPQERKPAPTFDEIIKRPVVYSVPGMDQAEVRKDITYRTAGETALKLDVYTPPGLGPAERKPAIVLIHGGPVAPPMSPKDWGVYVSYGKMAAASGFVGIAFNHRFYGSKEAADATDDIDAAIAHVRSNAESLRVDKDRLAIWAFSGGGTFLSRPLAQRPAFVRALVAYYATLDNRVPPPGVPNVLSDEERRALSPAAQLAPGAAFPPMLIARAGRDHPALNATIDTFLKEALTAGVPLELLNHPTGQHGFDILDDDARSKEIIARTLEFLKTHLG
jgi:acetyl esterase/lipase